MAFVEKITKLVHPGVLGNFDWPQGLPEFSRYNLIYGWNGTGKTTISRTFRSLEYQEDLEGGTELVLRLQGRDYKGKGISDKLSPVKVFNRDFVDQNVFSIEDEGIDPILILGDESVQKQKQIDDLKDRLILQERKLAKAKGNKDRIERSLDDFCITQASSIKNLLRSSEQHEYNNYNKRMFRSQMEKMLQDDNASSWRITDNIRDKHLAKLSEAPKPQINTLELNIPDLEALHRDVSDTLAKTVISQTIEALERDIELATWVHEGLKLHRARNIEECQFCNQPLGGDLLKRLESHFNNQYVEFTGEIDGKISSLEGLAKRLGATDFPDETRFYGWLVSDYVEQRAFVLESLDAVINYLNDLMEELENKKAKLFEERTLGAGAPETDFNLAKQVNAVILQHNIESSSYATQVSQSRSMLENDAVSTSAQQFVAMTKELEEIEKNIVTLENEMESNDKEIGALESDIVEHRKPAEELNSDLKKYLGHDDIRLNIKDSGYEIYRSNSLARSLSEGEKTAIALLYFLKTLEDRNFTLSKSIIVIDDPVSSLDMNSLYSAFGYIRDRTEDAGQLFILTHNFSFFQQVKNWFHHIKGQKKKRIEQRPCRFLMLTWSYDRDVRKSTLEMLDPLLEEYNSDYHYLFAKIYEASRSENGKNSLEHYYIFPNMARRLLEMFLAFRQPNVSGELASKLSKVEFDDAKKIRILRFLHTNSHGDAIGAEEHDPSVLAEGPSVLADVVDLIRCEDSKHFAAMEDLVNSGGSEDGSG